MRVLKCDKCKGEFNIAEDGALSVTLQDIAGGVVIDLCPRHGKLLFDSLEKFLGEGVLRRKPDENDERQKELFNDI